MKSILEVIKSEANKESYQTLFAERERLAEKYNKDKTTADEYHNQLFQLQKVADDKDSFWTSGSAMELQAKIADELNHKNVGQILMQLHEADRKILELFSPVKGILLTEFSNNKENYVKQAELIGGYLIEGRHLQNILIGSFVVDACDNIDDLEVYHLLKVAHSKETNIADGFDMSKMDSLGKKVENALKQLKKSDETE